MITMDKRVLDVREHLKEIIERKKKARAFYGSVHKSSRSYALYDRVMGYNEGFEEDEEQ